MGTAMPDANEGQAAREADCQCAVRDANEATERANSAQPDGAVRHLLRCECGDPACDAEVSLTHVEYEAVRAFGSRFVIGTNHENPENACVLSEDAGFAVIDVVAAAARYTALARHTRHTWVSNAPVCDTTAGTAVSDRERVGDDV
jgi:hypothetical protein